MSDETDDDPLCGFKPAEVMISYCAPGPVGGWYLHPRVWVGPLRNPGEKAKKWALRYSAAARKEIGIRPGVTMVIAEPGHFRQERKWLDLDGHRYYLLKPEGDGWRVGDLEVPIVDPHDGIHLLGGDNVRHLTAEQVARADRFETQRELEWWRAFCGRSV